MGSTNYRVFVTPQACQQTIVYLLKTVPEFSRIAAESRMVNYMMGTIHAESSFQIYFPSAGGYTTSNPTAHPVGPQTGSSYAAFGDDNLVQAQLRSTQGLTQIPSSATIFQDAYHAQGLTAVMGYYLFQGTTTANYIPAKFRAVLQRFGAVLPVNSTETIMQRCMPPIPSTNPPQPSTTAITNSILMGMVVAAWKYESPVGQRQADPLLWAFTTGYVGPGVDINGYSASKRVTALLQQTPYSKGKAVAISNTQTYSVPVGAAYSSVAATQGTPLVTTAAAAQATSPDCATS
jgi:hypothetical protein